MTDNVATFEALSNLDEQRVQGWRTRTGERVANVDLVVAIDAEVQTRTVSFTMSSDDADRRLVTSVEETARSAAADAARDWLRE